MVLILVVDDDPDTVSTIEAVVGMVAPAARVLGVTSVTEAQAIAAGEAVDVVLADAQMPGITGGDLLAWFRDCSPATYRILMSGHHHPPSLDAAHAFLRKPFRMQALMAEIPGLGKGPAAAAD